LQNNGVADWESVDAQALVRTIAAAALTGGALRFGYTRDGGAYSIGVYGDGDPYTVYVKPHEDLIEVLVALQVCFDAINDEQASARTLIKAPK
jgi:hypothetical protein